MAACSRLAARPGEGAPPAFAAAAAATRLGRSADRLSTAACRAAARCRTSLGRAAVRRPPRAPAAAAPTTPPSAPDPTASATTSGGAAEPDSPRKLATLLISFPDKKGVVASLGQLFYKYGCNILTSGKFSDMNCHRYFQRLVFDYAEVHVRAANMGVVESALVDLAARDAMEWTLSYASAVKRVVLLVSLAYHCLADFLMRVRARTLRCERSR